jgi:hypothetical protein
MSEREEITERISDFVFCNSLATVYSGTDLSKDKKYRYVLISKPRVLDGEIRVYGSKFIYVSYQTAYRSLPAKDRRIFTSCDDALNFLQLAFVEYKFDEALEVPTK